MQITIEELCGGICEALKKEGHEAVFYSLGELVTTIASDRTKYEIIRKEEESEIMYEIECKQGKLSDAVCNYIDQVKFYSTNFPSGAEKVIVGVHKENQGI